MEDDRRSDTYGYEPCGTSAGGVRGQSDFYETLKIARSEMLAMSPSLPQGAKDNLELFDRFIRASDIITKTLLARLSDIFNLTLGSRFEDVRSVGEKSRTTLVLFRYPKQEPSDSGIGHNKHTDISTLTLLFSEQ
ncbi:hypothetical protein BO71DRAFT_465852 [Aspergillus ellipticus CBS 707.79]|uniref:Isopenicillin N synthase-like Fe(2+) 2OG dioxygenase domain-containing protein n=1 Tax=Aspergillus ellipticus CBS 707.79 TaxID=1448320 RepID=A0A319EZX7_9EURO|nr:hypothetical protein BO71DRAFT_465852 [Aspergillus ellipticus CBS 707.79]